MFFDPSGFCPHNPLSDCIDCLAGIPVTTLPPEEIIGPAGESIINKATFIDYLIQNPELWEIFTQRDTCFFSKSVFESTHFSQTESGIMIEELDFNLNKTGVYLDSQKNHSIYVSVVNITQFSGVDYVHGIGFGTNESVAQIGYDGRIVDFSIDFLTVGGGYYYKNGKIKANAGLGIVGFGFSIDFKSIMSLIGG